MIITIPYKPHNRQIELHNDKHRYKVIVCGRRFGKTVFCVNEGIKKATEKPHNYWYIAPTYRQAKLISWDLFKYYCPPQIIKHKNEQELQLTLINGSNIRLIGADNPENLRGVGLGGVIFDEFADIKRNVWQTIVRPMLTESRGWAIFMGTPKGKLNQLYEMFIKDVNKQDKDYISIDGEQILPDDDFKSWQFKSVENPYLPPDEIEKAKKELSPQYFAQEYEASFENYTGIIYKEYLDRHNIYKVELKPYWRYYVGIDTGRHTAVTFMAVDENKTCYVFDELYNYDGIVRDISMRIKEKIAEYGIRPIFVIDSASQVKAEYNANGIYPQDSVKEVEDGIAKVRSLFSQDRLLFDCNKCKVHIVQHKGYVWDTRLVGVHKRPTPLKENDHTCDSLQYIIATFVLPKIETPDQEKYKKSLHYLNIQRNNNVLQKFS